MEEDRKSKGVLEFYFNANKNKERVGIDLHDRPYSTAEVVVMSCIDSLLIDEENASERIRYFLLNSLDGKFDNLKKADEYKHFISESNLLPIPMYNERAYYRAIGMHKDSDEVYDSYLSLRSRIRQGHIYWGVSGKRLESILEHIYGCLVLTLGIESEYGYSVDYDKIMKMLLLHETEEILIGDLTEWDVTKEVKYLKGKEAVNAVLNGFYGKNRLVSYIDEFNGKETLESEYANLIDKLEYDMQVKVYELEGRYDFSNYPDNVVTRSDSVQQIINNGATSVFDVHYEYDKNRYYKIPCLRKILEDTRKY